jgi:hypothetical protein
VTSIARIIGAATNTVRRWLKADHHDLYWQHWANFTDHWRDVQDAQARLPAHGKEASRDRHDALMEALNRDLDRIICGEAGDR